MYNFIGTLSAGELPCLREITSDYEVLLCDIWGVLHNGLARHAAADDALRRFRRSARARCVQVESERLL